MVNGTRYMYRMPLKSLLKVTHQRHCKKVSLKTGYRTPLMWQNTSKIAVMYTSQWTLEMTEEGADLDCTRISSRLPQLQMRRIGWCWPQRNTKPTIQPKPKPTQLDRSWICAESATAELRMRIRSSNITRGEKSSRTYCQPSQSIFSSRSRVAKETALREAGLWEAHSDNNSFCNLPNCTKAS